MNVQNITLNDNSFQLAIAVMICKDRDEGGVQFK